MNQPNKALGQHWLHDERILDHICSDAGVIEGDTVFEVGPGLGTLTARLLNHSAEVWALEFDHDLAEGLAQNTKKRLHRPDDIAHLRIEEGDIRRFNFSTLPANYKLCANIPYYLTSNLLRQLCDTSNKPLRAALLMQKEVTQRVTAADGKMSVLACFMQYFYEVREGVDVPAEAFTPPPKVDSSVLVMVRRDGPLFDVDETKFFRMIKAGFAGKRKNLRNTLSGGLRLTKEQVEAALSQASIDQSRRAESLSLEEWKTLYSSLDMLST